MGKLRLREVVYRAHSHAAGQRAGAGHGPAKRPLGLRRAGLRREHSSFCSVSCPLRRKSLLWEGMLCGPEGERHGEGNAGCPYAATALVPEKNKLVQIKVWAAGIACCVRFPLQGAWREAPVCRARHSLAGGERWTECIPPTGRGGMGTGAGEGGTRFPGSAGWLWLRGAPALTPRRPLQ